MEGAHEKHAVDVTVQAVHKGAVEEGRADFLLLKNIRRGTGTITGLDELWCGKERIINEE